MEISSDISRFSTPRCCGPSMGSLHMYCESEPMKTVQENIRRCAAGDFPVLITGERGVDKKGAARLVHALGRRKRRIVFRCFKGFAKAEGVSKFADGDGIREYLEDKSDGALIFEDIDQLNESSQLTLLDCLAAGAYDDRRTSRWLIVGTTNRDMETLALNNDFHPELYEAFARRAIEIPPLRSRLLDVALYAYHISERSGLDAKRDIPEDAFSLLMTYDYPGNLMELRTMLEEAFQWSACQGKKAFSEHVRNHIRNGRLASFYRRAQAGANGTAAAGLAKKPHIFLSLDEEKPVTLDEEGLAESLRCLPFGIKSELRRGIEEFFKLFETKVFYPRDLRDYLIENGFVKSIAQKTVSQYIGKLRENNTVEFIGGDANRRSYRLSSRFVGSPSSCSG